MKLRIVPCCLISNSQLEECLKSGNRKGPASINTVRNNEEGSKLFFKEFRFGEVFNLHERYWKAEIGLLCIICTSISYHFQKKCRVRVAQYIICASAHKVTNHRFGSTRCIVKMGRISPHITAKCTNYRENH